MKGRYVPVRMTDEMLHLVDGKKQEHQLRGRAGVIREAVHLYLKSDQPELTREMVEIFEAWRREFHGVSSNLNQIAYKMNANHPLSTDQICEILDELRLMFNDLAKNMRSFRRDLDL